MNIYYKHVSKEQLEFYKDDSIFINKEQRFYDFNLFYRDTACCLIAVCIENTIYYCICYSPEYKTKPDRNDYYPCTILAIGKNCIINPI